jgi:hypothetical protein
MNIILPWAMFGAAVVGIVLYGTWGRKERRKHYLLRREARHQASQNPRKAA